MIRLGEQVMRRLRAKHDPARAEEEWLRLRDDLLTMLQKEMLPLAERIEGQQVSPFAFATLHQRLGDLCRRFGAVEDARREYQQAHDRIARVAHDQPSNDIARATWASCSSSLARWRSTKGATPRGSRRVEPPWKIQQEIALHPRSGTTARPTTTGSFRASPSSSGPPSSAWGTRPLLAIGSRRRRRSARMDQARAQERFGQELLSEALVWLGVACSHLGDGPSARRHIEESLQICTALAQQFPQHLGFKGDLATVFAEQGCTRTDGQDDLAETAFNQSLAYAHAVLAPRSRRRAQRLITAGDSERLAASRRSEASRLTQPPLARGAEIRTELAGLETHNVPAQAALAVALASSAVGTRPSRRPRS